MFPSIIIPTFNRSDVILRSLATWTRQSISSTDFEVIVVDNNSTDNSAELINDFIKPLDNFKYVFESNPGSTNARHTGASVAKGDILIFCDDDGLFNSDCIKAILDVYQMRSDVAAVAGKIDIVWDAEEPKWITPYLFMLGKLDYGNEVCFGYDLYLNGGIFSIRKDVFKELGGFNPDLIGKYLVGDGDTGLVIKLHKANKLIGWTPFSVMQHLQFVKHHGNVADMGRRFYNTGISNAYGFFREQHFKMNLIVFKYMIVNFVFFVKKSLEYLVTNKYKDYFSVMQRKGSISFFMNLRHKYIRKEIVLK